MLIPLVVTSEGGVCQKLKIVFDLDFIYRLRLMFIREIKPGKGYRRFEGCGRLRSVLTG